MISPQLDRFVRFCEAIAAGPYPYSQAGGRCDPVHSGHADCSGLIVGATNFVGGTLECTGSFRLSQMCHEAGTGISMDEARARRGALVFMGVNEGKGGIPGVDPGHVAVSLGGGATVEARNSRAGILISPFDGRYDPGRGAYGWAYAAMPPWFPTTVDDAHEPAPAPPPKRKRKKMIFFRIPDHPNVRARATVWLTNSQTRRGMHSMDELEVWQFIAASAGENPNIGTIPYAHAQRIPEAH